ncbi:DUF1156 domain-containing protein [uncultured Desulfovibrio sp.]|uniref:DUF1156 domain-containing protein n=1 Tax=uncultured Desulfovibrio sp. TaxID=167968 RepID=UPI00345BFA16
MEGDNPVADKKRLIEGAFPLKQASLDAVHEKNVRHGHLSTLHIWPARRPLVACRAALLATLLPDPGSPKAPLRAHRRNGGGGDRPEKPGHPENPGRRVALDRHGTQERQEG